MKSHFSKLKQNQEEAPEDGQINNLQIAVIKDHTDNPKNADEWRPDHLICSKPEVACMGMIQKIQDRLIKEDKLKAPFIVLSEKLHITHLVTNESEFSEEMFNKANEKIQHLGHRNKYSLGPLKNYNGNLQNFP